MTEEQKVEAIKLMIEVTILKGKFDNFYSHIDKYYTKNIQTKKS